MVQKSIKSAFFVCLSTLFCSLSLGAAVSVDYFPMVHLSHVEKENELYAEQFTRSQHQLMTYLKENPNSVVFVESLAESLSQETYFDPKGADFELRDFYRKSIQVNFLNGVPALYDDFSDVQKMILRDHHNAAQVLFELGIVKSLEATNSREEYEEYVAKNIANPDLEKLFSIAAGFSKAETAEEAAAARLVNIQVFDYRERAALRSIQEYVKKNPSVQKVVLIFGASHDFYKYREDPDFQDLNIRKVNVKKYERSLAKQKTFDLFAKPEPYYESYRLNPQTGLFELIPGMFPY